MDVKTDLTQQATKGKEIAGISNFKAIIISLFTFRDEIYHSSTLSDSSFYETYDPFEYMVAKAQRQEVTDDPDNRSAIANKTADQEPIYATPNRHLKKHARHASISGK